MRNITRTIAAGGALTALLLATACSSPDPSPAESSSPVASPSSDSPATEAAGDFADTGDASILSVPGDFWFYSDQNAVGKFSLPGEEPEDLAKLRETADGDPLTYVQIVIDNREGSAGANMYALTGFDEAGKTYDFQEIEPFLEQWEDSLDLSMESEADYNLSVEFTDTINKYMGYVDAGAVGTIWMATDEELPEEFTQITAEVHGAGTTTYVVSQSDSQGIDLTFEDPND